MGLGIATHLFDLVLGETAGGSDNDVLTLAGTEILGTDIQDTIGVDVESDFDLRNAAGSRRDVGQLEFTQRLVVAGELAFALEHVDFYTRLVVAGRREDFRLAARDGGVAVDEFGGHATQSLDAQGQRGDVEQ